MNNKYKNITDTFLVKYDEWALSKGNIDPRFTESLLAEIDSHLEQSKVSADELADNLFRKNSSYEYEIELDEEMYRFVSNVMDVMYGDILPSSASNLVDKELLASLYFQGDEALGQSLKKDIGSFVSDLTENYLTAETPYIQLDDFVLPSPYNFLQKLNEFSQESGFKFGKLDLSSNIISAIDNALSSERDPSVPLLLKTIKESGLLNESETTALIRNIIGREIYLLNSENDLKVLFNVDFEGAFDMKNYKDHMLSTLTKDLMTNTVSKIINSLENKNVVYFQENLKKTMELLNKVSDSPDNKSKPPF